MHGTLIAFQKCNGHTYIQLPTVRNPIPRANALGNYNTCIYYNYLILDYSKVNV